MNINYKETQIDFLAHVAGKGGESLRPRYMAAQISLTLENLVILTIVAIMVVIFSFAVGIERGKKIALTQPSEQPVAETVKAAGVMPVSNPIGKGDKIAGKNDAQDQQADFQKARPVVDLKAVAAVPAPLVAGSGSYTVQVASYKNQKPAQREAEQLKQKGFQDVYVLPKGAYVIVCVGNFQKKEDASDVKRQLKSRYQDFVVRRL